MKNFKDKDISLFLIIGILIVYICNLFIDIMEVDAAQYASISWEMLHKHSFLQITNRFEDYLDKPPLLFWFSSLSFYPFGFHNWSYKLPSVLALILGVYSTYNLGRLIYNTRVGLISALVLASSQAVFLISNDIRTDTNLLAFVAFGVYHLLNYLRNQKWTSLILAFFGISLAMMAKGPIGLIVPILAVGATIVFTQNFKLIFKWEWLLGILLIALFLSPMCYGLYQQFGWNGVNFFFWEQSFGRITGSNEWKNDSGGLFFVHTTAWAFLPWTLFLILGLLKKFIRFREIFISGKLWMQWVPLFGFVLPFIALSFSQYKLPHYIFVVYPFAALITGNYLVNVYAYLKADVRKIIAFSQLFIIVSMLLIAVIIGVYVFPITSLSIGGFILIIGLAYFYMLKQTDNTPFKIVYSSIAIAIIVNLILSLQFYPELLKFQPSNEAGKIFVDKKQDDEKLFGFELNKHYSLDYYSQSIVGLCADLKTLQDSTKNLNTFWIYTGEEGARKIKENYKNVEEKFVGNGFLVTRLNINFLNPNKRKINYLGCICLKVVK